MLGPGGLQVNSGETGVRVFGPGGQGPRDCASAFLYARLSDKKHFPPVQQRRPFARMLKLSKAPLNLRLPLLAFPVLGIFSGAPG